MLNSATEAEQASTEDVAGALGIEEDEVGNATDGYKAIGMEVPAGVTLPAENTPFFVITRHSSGRNHVGFGYMPRRRAGFERILAILFKLLKDPANTTNYMTVEAGDNTVAATDSAGETSGDTSTVNRVVFVAADGTAFAMKTDGTVPLQAQDTKGNATAIDTTSGDDDDDDNNSTSRHGGGSSGCDAGFGLIALAAVALAACKIRK
ncbi:MAG: hypothetical protein IJ667_03255 [Synergistaceae bacterium]|nr:hypothetical protein [Synergistaceae bacterium]